MVLTGYGLILEIVINLWFWVHGFIKFMDIFDNQFTDFNELFVCPGSELDLDKLNELYMIFHIPH